MQKSSLTADLFELLAQPFTAEAMFDQIPDIVFFIKNIEGRYVCVNRTLVKRSGKRSKSQLIGCTPSQILGEHLGRGYAEQDRKVLQGGQQLLDQLELHVYQNREVGWCLTSKLPMLGKNGKSVGLVGISRDLKSPDVTGEDFEHIAEAVQYAEARLSNPPSITRLAEVACMSSFQLDRRMKRLFGVSTGQWILKSRLSHASQQLLETDVSIANIAFDCGYTDQSAFTKQFRRTTGQTPSGFRKLRKSPPQT